MVEMDPPLVERMQRLVQRWEETADQRSIFLTCYMMMTRNMLTALSQGEFKDPAWVDRLLRNFAEYYFAALERYDHDPANTPVVWRVAHRNAQNPKALALQKLLLGVNAHINYDLVLTLDDLLSSEWGELSQDKRAERYFDYCYVNDVIGRTIDAVQDQVLEPAMPILDIFDKLMGRADELLISRLITSWRFSVWQHATRLFESRDPAERSRLIQAVEQEALNHASAIGLTDWRKLIDEVL